MDMSSHTGTTGRGSYPVGPQPVILSTWMAIGAVGYPGATDFALNSEEGSLEPEIILWFL